MTQALALMYGARSGRTWQRVTPALHLAQQRRGTLFLLLEMTEMRYMAQRRGMGCLLLALNIG